MPSLWSLRYSIWGKLYLQCMLNAALCYLLIWCRYWVSYRNTEPGITPVSGFDLVHISLMVILSIMCFTLFLFGVFTAMLWAQSVRHRSALIGCSFIPIGFGAFGLYGVLMWLWTGHVLWVERIVDVFQNTTFN